MEESINLGPDTSIKEDRGIAGNRVDPAIARAIKKAEGAREKPPKGMVKVRYLEGTKAPGWTTVYKKGIAEIFAARGLVEILDYA